LICSAGAITYSVKISVGLLNNSKKNEEELHELILKTKDVYHTIDNSVEGLYSKTSETVVNSNEIISRIQDISNGSESQINIAKNGVNLSDILRENTESIRENADIMHDSALKIVKMGKDGGNTLDILINKQQDSASHIDKIYNAAKMQSETIKEISVFTKMIMSIAQASKLLALNASVEAAKAGNEGRGFAVVANEIKKMAAQSDDNAKEISQIIRNVLKTSENVMKEVEAAKQIAIEESSAVGNTRTIVNDLNDVIKGNMKEIEKVYNQVSALENIKEDVSKLMNDILTITSATSTSTQQIFDTIEDQTSSIKTIDTFVENLSGKSKELKLLLENKE
jgi:methyl-accepting chemotaxis protein